MELEELKNAWAELDNRLKENKSMNKAIIMEMTQSKADKLVNWFMNQEKLAVIVLILLLPLILFAYHQRGGKWITWDILIISCAVICTIYPIWGMYKLSKLAKIDFSKPISDNIRYTNLYNLFIKREVIVSIFLLPFPIIVATLAYVEARANAHLLMFAVCTFLICTLLTYWSYKKYNKNMASILKSLNEIKQLEETE